eukprot:8505732-Pyramimonas_sp.AAC.1
MARQATGPMMGRPTLETYSATRSLNQQPSRWSQHRPPTHQLTKRWPRLMQLWSVRCRADAVGGGGTALSATGVH